MTTARTVLTMVLAAQLLLGGLEAGTTAVELAKNLKSTHITMSV